MFRELKEEIGLDRDDVIIIGKTTKWLSYEIPKSYIKGTSNYKGQKQIWFLLKFLREDGAINLNTTTKPEFDQWEWIKYEDAIKKTINFKSFVYKKAYSELSKFLY
jgi:putative (di)nucleoside polyphosphate hydrolase